MSMNRTTAPSSSPVTVAEAKKQLEIWDDDSTHDAHLRWLIEAATEFAESYTGRAFITQTWQVSLTRFPLASMDRFGQSIVLPRPPLQSITSIQYVDSDGVTQTVSSSDYQVVTGATPGYVCPAYDAVWPAPRYQPEAVTVTYVAGYGNDPSDVPQIARQGILMLVAHWFENREAVTTTGNVNQMPLSVKSCLGRVRVGNRFATYGVTM